MLQGFLFLPPPPLLLLLLPLLLLVLLLLHLLSCIRFPSRILLLKPRQTTQKQSPVPVSSGAALYIQVLMLQKTSPETGWSALPITTTTTSTEWEIAERSRRNRNTSCDEAKQSIALCNMAAYAVPESRVLQIPIDRLVEGVRERGRRVDCGTGED